MKNFRLGIGFLLALALAFWAGTLYKTSPPVSQGATLPEQNSLSEVISSATGSQVIPFNPNNTTHQTALTLLQQVAENACTHFNQVGSSTKGMRRINEASKHFEDFLRAHLDNSPDFSCDFAKTASGKSQRSGYPDLHLTHTESGIHFYLDPKLYEATSETSSLRTFYYSPNSKNQKIQHHAVHLLIGFAHDGKDGDWTFLNSKIVDLSNLPLTLKSEYNASNKELYQSTRILKK